MQRTNILICFLILISGNVLADLQWDRLSSVRHPDSLKPFLRALEDSVESSLPRAFLYLHQMEQRVEAFQYPPLIRQYWFIKGKYYDLTGRYQEALEVYLQCARQAEARGAEADYLRAMNNVAVLYARMERFQLSNNLFRRLIPRALRHGDQQRVLILYVNMANNFLTLNQLDSAAYYYQQALPLTHHGSFFRAAVEVNLARLYLRQKDYRRARQFAQRSAAYADSAGNREMYLESLANLVNSYKEERQWEKALSLCLTMERTAKQFNLPLQLRDVYLNLAEIYQSRHHYQSALAYYFKYDQLKDSLFNLQVAQQMQELKVKYDTERVEAELALKESMLRRREMQIRFLTAMVMGILLFSGGIAWFYFRQRAAYRILVQKSLQWSTSNLATTGGRNRGSGAKGVQPSEEKKRQITRALRKELITQRAFTEPDLTLEKLALRLNTNSRYLSQIVHEVFGTSFPQLLNNLRVQEAIRLFREDRASRYTIEGISQTVGFNSKSSFNAAFKKITGVTPSYFRNELNRLEPEK